jgi:hypothetical protein
MIFSCENRDSSAALIKDLPTNKSEYQKRIVGDLSGKYPLADQSIIKSRWSEIERSQTRDYLFQLIATLDIEPRVHKYTFPNLNPAIDLLLDPFEGTNVYGILSATSKSDSYVVLGAHYDSGKRNAPGAIDNATGIALIYSVIKELTKIPARDKNIVIVFFDQEEEELIGSKAFAKFILKQQWDIHSIHCFDMVGWDEDKDRAMEMYSASTSLMNTYKMIAEKHGVPLNDIVIDPVGYDKNSTDFDAFIPDGFNVIGAGECYYFKDSSPYKDTPDDTFETVDFDYLLSCSNLIEDIILEIVAL